MGTAKKKLPARRRPTAGPSAHAEAYRQVLQDYEKALELMRRGDFAQARERLLALAAAAQEEPELADRARTYAAVCERKLAPPPAEPENPEDCYVAGVVAANAGRLDEAHRLLERALAADPEAAKYLYARASVFALEGRAEEAVAYLRRAIRQDPPLRFQAANDPDFEALRDDAAFIDVIESAPAGV